MRAFIFLAVLVLLGNASPTMDLVINQLNEKVGTNSYGKQLVELVELHLLQGSPVQEVITLIQQILTQLEQDQQSDDAQHSSRMAEYENTVQTLEQTLENLNLETQDNNRLIGDLSESIAHLAQSVGTMQRQLTLISSREEVIRQTRSDETTALQRRQQNNERILNAINQINTRLTRAVNSQGALVELEERNQIVAEAKKELGDTHPIVMLIQMTNKFDAATVQRVVEKLESIAHALENSRVSDEHNEETTQRTFLTVLNELSEVRERLSTDYNQSNNLQRTRQNDLAVTQRRRDEIVQTQEQTENILVQTRNQKNQFDSGYLNRRESRTAEIELIRQAHELISNHAESLNRN